MLTQRITIATWNVNSIKARLDRVLAFLERASPDVVCLQELKLVDDAFPSLEIKAAGYHAVTHGQKTYNGVAILAKDKPTNVTRGLEDDVIDDHARVIAADVYGVRVVSAYFPNGGTPSSDKFTFKLTWMERFRRYLDRKHTPADPLLVCGDFNVAPDDLDVGKPERWRNTVLCRDEVRVALARIREFGLVDVFRKMHPEGGIYSWWDYRMLSFPKGNGLRIDHIDATPALAQRCVEARVDREERKGKNASDHAPVLCTFEP